jgi:hypothetical protein
MVTAIRSVQTGVRVLLASFVALVVVVTLATAGAAAVLVGSPGQQGLGLLVVSVLAAFVFVAVAAVVAGWLLARTLVSTARSLSATWRIGLVRQAAALEAANPLARWVRVADRVAVLDPRTAEERTTDALDELRSRYVDGELTERELETGLATVLEAGDSRFDAGRLEVDVGGSEFDAKDSGRASRIRVR